MKIDQLIVEWLSERYSRSNGPTTSYGPANEFSIGTTRGLVREENEDRLLIAHLNSGGGAKFRDFVIAALCDGMGGAAEGARCAEIAVAHFLEKMIFSGPKLNIATAISRAAECASDRVFGEFGAKGGTTISACVVLKNGVCNVLNVGDSRVYHADREASPAKLCQLTEDDTIANEVAKIKGERISELQPDYYSNDLGQFVGMGKGLEPKICEFSGSGELVITSDGAHGMPAETFRRLVLNAPTTYEVVRRLLQTSVWLGGSDNASVACVNVDSLRHLCKSSAKVQTPQLSLWTVGAELKILNFWATDLEANRAQKRNSSSRGRGGRGGRPIKADDSKKRETGSDELRIDVEQSELDIQIEGVEKTDSGGVSDHKAN